MNTKFNQSEVARFIAQVFFEMLKLEQDNLELTEQARASALIIDQPAVLNPPEIDMLSSDIWRGGSDMITETINGQRVTYTRNAMPQIINGRRVRSSP